MKVGDVIKLKSGSSLMTIQGIGNWDGFYVSSIHYEKDQAKCFWFNGKEQEEGIFYLNSLLIVEENK